MQPNALAAGTVERVGGPFRAEPDKQASEDERSNERQTSEPERLHQDPAEAELGRRWRIDDANDDRLNRAHIEIVPPVRR